MRINFIILFFSLFTFNITLNAQNWRSINSSRISWYKASEGNYFALKMDSVLGITNGDTIFKPYTFNPSSNQSTIQDTSWIGQKAIKKADGWDLFITCKGDTVKINTKAKLNDSWEFNSNISASGIYSITLTELGVESFIGLMDSVKTFTVANNNSTINLKFKISKNYGLLNTVTFKCFPSVNALTFAGIERVAGFQNITAEQIYDFEVGDEFQTYDEDCESIYCMERDLIDSYIKVLSKSYSPNKDTVYYTVKSVVYTQYPLIKAESIDSSTKVIKYEIVKNELNKLPSSKPCNPNYDYLNTLDYFTLTLNDSSKIKGNFNTFAGGGSDIYKKNLGLYSKSYLWEGGNTETYEYEYYHLNRSNKTFGKRIDRTLSIDNPVTLDDLIFSPNPFSDFTKLLIPNTYEILELKLFDNLAKQVKAIEIKNQSEIILQRNGLLPGIYFYSISNRSKNIQRGTLMIE